MATQGDIKHRFQLTAELVAIRHGMRFAPDCKTHVDAFIDNGVQEVVLQNADSDEIKLQLAEAGIAALVEKMVQNANAQGLRRLQESTFFEASAYLCPLWPFCR